jgi:hypothetical protein
MADKKQYCPLCRAPQDGYAAVRVHLIAAHKRDAATADEMLRRFDITKPIPEPEYEPIYCAVTW